VNRRLVLVGLVIDGQSEGHGVTPIDLSMKPGQPQLSCLQGRTPLEAAQLGLHNHPLSLRRDQ
jgi:hypothetical protein